MLDRRFQIPDPAQPKRDRTGPAPSAPLVDFVPPPLNPAALHGRRIEALSENIGTYGMGGAGYFGLKLDTGDWFVIAVRGAASWMTANGRLIEDFFYQDDRRPRPWLTDDDDELSPRILGHAIAAIEVQPHSLAIRLGDGFHLAISPDPATRPIFHGSKQPRAFEAADDLRRNVFLSPTDEIWV